MAAATTNTDALAPLTSTGTSTTAAGQTGNNTTNSPGTTPPSVNVPPSPTAALPADPTANNVSFTGYNPNTTNGGLINTAQTPLANTTASQSTNWNVDPSQLTSTQLNNILQSNSPLMGQASLQADQSQAARGLLNSSMTSGAEEQAMINSATPIAEANANTLAAAGAQNAQESTQANLATASQANAASQQQASAISTAQQSNAAAVNTALQFVSQGNLTASQTNAGNALQAALTKYTTTANVNEQTAALASAQQIANIQGQYSNLINSNSTLGSAFSNLMSNVASIYSNPDITDPKSAAAPLIQSFTNYADTVQNINGLNVANNFQWSGSSNPLNPPGTTTGSNGSPVQTAKTPSPGPATRPVATTRGASTSPPLEDTGNGG